MLNDRSQLCEERRLGGDEESSVMTLGAFAKEKINKQIKNTAEHKGGAYTEQINAL